MKLKTTNTAIRNGYYHIISIGYCDMQNLLRYKQAFAYNAGVYGWNHDCYEVNGVCISTGYRPINNVNSIDSYKLMKDYEIQASAIRNDYTMSYDRKVELVNKLLELFVKQCIK